MILYHFTTTDRVRSICETGIKALPFTFGNCETVEGIRRERGIWLTECETTRMTADESAASFRMCGEWRQYWMHAFTDKRVARITVRIGDHDQRLVRFDAKIADFDRFSSRTWLYTRTLTPDKITNIDLEDRPARPSWEGDGHRQQAA